MPSFPVTGRLQPGLVVTLAVVQIQPIQGAFVSTFSNRYDYYCCGNVDGYEQDAIGAYPDMRSRSER